MTATGWITRVNVPGGSLAQLDLFTFDSGLPSVPIYDFAEGGLDPGSPPKRRQIAESMYVLGDSQLASVQGRAPGKLVFIVTGKDGATFDTNLGVLLVACRDQPSWELHVKFEGSREYAWEFRDCEPTVGFQASVWTPGDGSGLWCPVTFIGSRHPIPIAGPY